MRSFAYILFVLTAILLSVTALAQRDKIDSLKKALPSLTDSARLSCLNEICVAYTELNRDSSVHYAIVLYDESKKINNLNFMGDALFLQNLASGNNDNFVLLKKTSLEALQLWKKSNYLKGLVYGYNRLGFTLLGLGDEECIRVLDTCYQLSEKAADTASMIDALTMLAIAWRRGGDYEKSFEKSLEAISLARQSDNKTATAHQLTNLGNLFVELDEYETALRYYRQAYLSIKPQDYKSDEQEAALGLAGLFCKLHRYDSARHYFDLVDTTKPKSLRFYLSGMTEYYFLQKEYDKALELDLRGLGLHQQSHDNGMISSAILTAAKIYASKQDTKATLQYAWKSLDLGKKPGSKWVIRESSQILHSVYDRLQKKDSAYYYYRQFVAMNDSILTSQLKGKLAASGLQQKIDLLNKEYEVQNVTLQKESLVKKISIAGIVVLLLLSAIIFRNIMLKRRNEKQRKQHVLELQKRESEKTRIELQKQAAELEMQALRAQMNPHFIFNSLNSIYRFILQNNKVQASEYLTKFSKLVRSILQNSQASLITLQSELQSLELYLDLEALRFDHRFDYKISVPKDLDINGLKVPPLIIQPYVENAIWHGLMHLPGPSQGTVQEGKEEKGQLDIEASQEGANLYIKVSDNGVGRKAAAAMASKSATKNKSVGLKITAERIAMCQISNENEPPVTINDLVYADGTAAGTEVIIRVPVLYH